MSRQHTMWRLIIPAALTLAALLITACENPTNATPTDPNSLVLPAGTIQGWDGSSHADANRHLDWFGRWSSTEGNTFSDFRKISLLSSAYPGQSVPLSELEGRLRSSSDRGGDRFVFDSSYPAQFINPEVQMLGVVGLYNGWLDVEIFRADSSAPDIRIEWWYVSADTVVNGTRTPSGGDNEIADNVELTEGWNTVIFTKDGANWTITAGAEPVGIGWYID